ncbi:unnamed protein product [Calypogeia fissa]
MAGARPLMPLIDSSRRDRITGGRFPQRHPVAAAAAVGAGGGPVGFQTLNPHFSLTQHQRFDGLEEEEVGRMAGGGGGGGVLWTVAHEQQQRALGADGTLRQRRVNTIQPLPTLANSLIHQGPGPGGQPANWDGGGVVRHIGSISSRGRMDRNLILDEQEVRLRQQQHNESVVNLPRGGGEFPRGGISREVFAGGLRLRDSRDGILSNELVKSSMRSHMSLLDDAPRMEMPRAYQQQQQQQGSDPLTRNRSARFGVEENGHAELIARYGDRPSSRNLERAHDAIGRGYQLENLSRKRAREEEANLDRDRLIRHRKLSGIGTPSPLRRRSPLSGIRQLKESNQEIHQHKAAKYWEVEAEESERKAHVHDKQRNQEFQHHKAKYWQQLRTEDDEHKANVHKQKDRNQGFQQRKTAKYWQQLQKQEGGQNKAKGQQKDRNREFQKHKAAKYWQQRLPQEDDHDSHVQQQETNQEIQQHKAKYWKLHSEEDEREEGQVTPPSPILSLNTQQQHEIESNTHLLKQEQDLMIVSSRTEDTPQLEVKVTGSFLSSSRPQSRSSRSPKARENSIPDGDELKPLGRSREHSVQTRERPPSSPRFNKNERNLSRLDRLSSDFESNSILTLDLSDMHNDREGTRESQKHTRVLNSKQAGRLYHDGPHQKHQQQVLDTFRRERDLRSLNSSREFRDSRSGGAELDSPFSDRLRKESSGRTENILKRKMNPNTTATGKDNRHVGEMTISLQKHGQRIVKVEDYNTRDASQSRLATNKDHRLSVQRGGSFRPGSDDAFPGSFGRDRFSVAKRKEYEGRSPAATREKTPRSQSSPRQHYLEKPASQDRFPPYSQLVKDELVARSENYEPEPHRHQSIFSRLVGLRPETNPTRAAAETKRKDSNLRPVHEKASLPSSSKKSPGILVETAARNDVHGSPHEFPGFQISTRSRSTDFSREFEGSGSKNLSRKNSIAELVPSWQAEPCESPNNGSPKLHDQDVLLRNDSAMKPQLESAESRLFSPLEQGVEELRKDLTLLESPKLNNSDQSKSIQEGVALSSGDSGGTARLVSSEMGAADGSDQLPGNGLKVHPKVIATGHRKDQVLKKSVLDAEKVLQRSSSLPVEAVILEETLNQEKGDGGLSILSAKDQPGQETPSPNSKAEQFGSPNSLPDCDPAIPRSDLEGKQPMGKGTPSEFVSTNVQSVGTGSITTSSYPPRDPSKSSLEAVDFEHPNPPPTVEIPSYLESLEDVSGHSDGDTQNGLSVAPVSSSALSTPKEVRLFGANLTAHMGERIDLTPKTLESMDQHVVESSILPTEHQDQQHVVESSILSAEHQDQEPVVESSTLPKEDQEHVVESSMASTELQNQDAVSMERNLDCTVVIQGLEKHICPPVAQIGAEPLSPVDKPIKAEQSVLVSKFALHDPPPIAHNLPLEQAQFEESPSVPKEQHPPVPQMQNVTAAAPSHAVQLSSSHIAGAHTWRRGTSSSSTPVNNANVFRSRSLFGGVIQPAGRSKSAQSTDYVRKGNSLVRAPGAAKLPSSSDIKAVSVIPGQARPVAGKFPTMKRGPFRNTFIANPTTSKPYFSSSRKYVAPSIESDAAFASFVRPVNPPKIPNCNNDLGKSQLTQLAMMKAPPRVVVRVSDPQGNSNTLLTPHQEQQSGVTSSPELSVLDGPDDRSGAAGVCRSVDKTSSSHCTDILSVSGNLGSRVLETPVSAKRLYVRRKANQLVVANAQNSNRLSLDTESMQASKTGYMLDHYFKRKTNQLVRSMSGKGSLARNVARNSLGNGLSSNIPDKQGVGSTSEAKKIRRGRVMRLKKDSPGRSSWVWTLNGADLGHANNSSAESRRTGSSLFPWKRQNSLRTSVRSQKLRPLPEVEKGSFLFLMSKRLRRVRPVQPVYTRSADGFSLHRSGVLSVGGGNLKWTKSLEKRAKQASEEVTKAVAEAERRKREKKEAVVEAAANAKDGRRVIRKGARGEGERIVWVGLVRYKMDAASKTLQRVQDSQGEAGDTDKGSSTGWAMPPPLLTPRRSIIGGTVYLRVGNGNQLVRDPKTASRALASEKVRWSLHNARSRNAKKQQYCQFFTKFGKCNKESGKCPYIHDPDKVAVCTKFLNGNCNDGQCLLTHKVIPERMPDCSFFLEGLCTNENCPYRHVHVNPKASYCDGFLRGYCKDGDKCNKKHTYVCSVYAETGECPDRSTCKFHHPKKKVKVDAPLTGHKIGAKSKQRYFSTVEPQPIRRKVDVNKYDQSSTVIENGQTSNEGSMEFISLSNIESDGEQTVMSPSEPWPDPVVPFTMKEAVLADEIEKWIKPTFLLQMTSSTAVAH